ncbi:MAG TPA: calcium-binding protein, partial [Nitrospira sp.]|nr:calcium-binding protein [Nitrospira sp.]
MSTDITAWLQFAIQQMSSECYLDGINLLSRNEVKDKLLLGNNHPLLDPVLSGKTRFTNSLADQFLDRYQIVDHHADDASGFSATLLFDTQTNSYTLSFRSLEFRNQAEGGDYERDGRNASGLTSAASGEIAFSGFAFAQLMSMEQYFKDLQLGKKSDGTVDPALEAFFANPSNRINLTGYSLGGHLATVFTELHASRVEHAYIFNGSGRGRIAGFAGTAETTLSDEALRIDAMLDRFNEILSNPERGVTKASDRDLPVYQAAIALYDANPKWDPFESGSNENIYLDARYQWAKLATLFEFDTVGTATLEIQTGRRGIAVDQGSDPKILQIYGLAATDDANFVAVSGLFYGPAQPVLIEGQPLLAGQIGIFPSFDESGSSHSLTLIVDSLAVQELIHRIDPRYGQSGAELLIRAASNERPETGVAPLDTPGVAESDSLEKTVEAFRKLFRDPALPAPDPLPIDSRVGGFGNLANRNAMYTAMAAVQQTVEAKKSQGTVFTLTDLTDPSVDRATLLARADENTADGLAYRYALKELNPFVVTANTESETGTLYAPFNSQGELDLYDPSTGKGTFTTFYMDDRAAFLKEKVALNQADQDISSGSIYFFDATEAYEIATAGDLSNTRQFLFGSAGENRFESGSKDDDLYGGGGVDLLIGNGGNDYLQGDGGADQLEGDDGADTLVGGEGKDILVGGTGNDILDGGLDDDTLQGGDGVDTYIIRASDGADTIEDSDDKGVVQFDDQVLGGALHREGDAQNVYHSDDGTITFTKQGNDLVVTGSGPLTIKNFSNGEFGIRLVDRPVFGDAIRTGFDKIDHYVQVGNNPDGSPILNPVYAPFFDENGNDTRSTASPGGLLPAIGDENNLIHALGGNDYIFSGAGDDQLYGDAGSDQIYGGLGNDRLFGGTEDDYLYGDDGTNSTSGGNDYLDGGDGNDFLEGGAGRDILIGGAGDDLMSGDETAGSDPGAADNSGAFDDWLDGGSGNDILHGGSGSDVLIGGADNDWLIGDTTQYQNGRPEQGGNDVLDGGTGDDELDGLYGNDLLLGGAGKDLLNGQDGSDVLYGGDDNDILSGDLRVQSVGPDQYIYDMNEYRAAGGNDLLFGNDGNDIMIGGEGSDTLEGSIGDDALFGAYNMGIVSSSDPLYWTLFTASGNDSLDAGPGNDGLHGGIGADTLLGKDGNDLLYGSGGDDVLEGGTGDDVLYGDYFPGEFNRNPFLSQITALAGNNRLDGGEGNDDLYGGDLADILIGGAGNDRLFGGRGVDVLSGGEGDDRIVDDDPNTPSVGDNETLDGGAGNDYLESWGGDDVLLGGTGKDTLVSHAGKDQLFGGEGDDRLIWDTVSEEGDHPNTGPSTQIMYGGTGDDVYQINSPGADAMEFANEGTDLVIALGTYTLPDNIENLNTDGTGIGNSLDNIITATLAAEGRDGNDMLIGLGRLDGGAGDDLLEGGSRLYIYPPPPPPPPDGELTYGSPPPPPGPTVITNTYVFGRGYGHDTIQEMDPEFNSAYYRNLDTVEFLSGIAPSDITWQRQGNDLELSVNGGADRLTIESFYELSFNIGGYNVNGLWVPPQGFEKTVFAGFPSYYAHSQVESFTFSDGITWGADHFNAPLLGDFREDTYKFGIGAGAETVIDFDFAQYNAADKQVDHVDVGPGVSASNLSVSIKNGVDLVLSIDGSEDSLTMQSFLTNVVVFAPFTFRGYTTLPYQIEEVRFDDGTTWSVTDLYNRISTISGTADADFLNGNSGNNLIQGLAANDSLSGGNGNDVLDGGAGNDYLEGGPGSDTYLFGRGGGQDTVRSEDFSETDLDVVRLGVDVLPSDVTIRTGGGGDDLIVQINGTSDQLSLYRFLSGPFYQIDQLIFGDGTVWDISTITTNAQGSILTGTDGPDTLRGSVLGDVLSGMDGNDVLIGFQGNDRLIGGTGDDDLDGGAGNDSYVINRGDGIDTVYDTALPGEGNQIQFGDGIAPSDLSFERIDTWLYVHVGTGDDTIRLRNFDPTGVNGSVVTQTLRFSDGSTHNLVDLLNPAVNHTPTVANQMVDQTVQEDAPFSIQVPANTFSDPDTGDTLTY